MILLLGVTKREGHGDGALVKHRCVDPTDGVDRGITPAAPIATTTHWIYLRSLEGELMRKGDRKRMGPADSNKDTEDGRRARVTLTLGVVMLVVGLLVVFGGLGAGDRGGDGDDAAVAESNTTETERDETEDTEEPRVNESETTETETEANKSTEEMNETEGTEKSGINETPNTTGSDIDVIGPELGSEQRIQNRLESLNPARNSSIHI